MLLPPIHNIAEICFQKGITDAVLCPGSRSAALTISFVRHPHIKTYSISDERSAAFIALGMAQISQKPVVLVCTSGTAAYNFAPAVAEAFFQGVPLLVLTADRPPEWINQHDGQTIFQENIYGKHVKKNFVFPADYSHADSAWQIERTLNEAINLAESNPPAPVHINVPIREPFYPNTDEKIVFNKNVRTIKQIKTTKTLDNETWTELINIWNTSPKRIIAVGQSQKNKALENALDVLVDDTVIISDIISNVAVAGGITSQDVFLASQLENQSLKPDLLITCGASFISKNLKLFLRKNKPTHHWHIEDTETLIDTFQSLSNKIPVEPVYFFETLNQLKNQEQTNFDYLKTWQNLDMQASAKLRRFLKSQEQFNDFSAVSICLSQLPENSIIHLGNSMSVRYANLTGQNLWKNIEFFANRGTSGIDGTLSTAVGEALKTDKIVTCLVGDVAFFYDRNAFWNNYLPDNLRIILMNNHGGNIFSMIDGPAKQPELKTYFETAQPLKANHLAKEFSLDYALCDNFLDLENHLKYFFEASNHPKILEIETNADINAEAFRGYKNSVCQ